MLPPTAALVPDLTFRGDIKLNSHLRLHRGCVALASLLRTLPRPGSPWRSRGAKILGAAASFIRRNSMSFFLANKPDDDPIDLVEMRRQITILRSQHSDNLLVTSRLNRFLVKIAFLSEPKDAAHEQHLRSEFVRTLQNVEAIASRSRSAKPIRRR